MPHLTRVCVYAGSSAGADPAYARAAGELAHAAAVRGLGLVYGGGGAGLMGALADAALAAGAEVTGVIPHALVAREAAHPGVADMRVVASMHERKALMAELADAFVALPGGIGTLEEVIEIATWNRLGLHRKPSALLNVGGYWDGLVGFLDHAVAQGFLAAGHRGMLLVEPDPATVLDRLAAWEAPPAERWLAPGEE